MFYAMREALAVMQEEGLAAMWARHKEMHERLWLGLSELGLEPFVEADADRCVFFCCCCCFVGVCAFWGAGGGGAPAFLYRTARAPNTPSTRPLSQTNNNNKQTPTKPHHGQHDQGARGRRLGGRRQGERWSRGVEKGR